jgi:hypothetical protein
VDGLVVVDVAVGLGEVTVAVVVVAVPLVEAGEVLTDLRVGLARGPLRGEPGVGSVLDERAHVLVALGLAVVGLVPLHLDPVADIAVDGVPAAGHLLVRLLHGLAALIRQAVEEHVEVVLAVEVGSPVRRVVDAAVGLRDLVVHRTGRGVLVLAVAPVAELHQRGEDLVAARDAELGPLALHPNGRRAAAGSDLALTVEHQP